MFETVQQSGHFELMKRLVSLLVSATVHFLAILVLVILPLIYFNILPDIDLVTFLIAAPPPPAPLPPPAPPIPAGEEVSRPVRQLINEADLTPRFIPKGVPPPDSKDLDFPAPYLIPAGTGPRGLGIPGGVSGTGLTSLLGPIVLPQAPPQPPPVKRANAVRAGGVVLDGMLVKKSEPEYPPIARAARVSGKVILQAHIDEEGSVEAIDVLSGHPLLVDAAVSAVRQWKYSPTLLNGEPVPVIGTITVIFNLR